MTISSPLSKTRTTVSSRRALVSKPERNSRSSGPFSSSGSIHSDHAAASRTSSVETPRLSALGWIFRQRSGPAQLGLRPSALRVRQSLPSLECLSEHGSTSQGSEYGWGMNQGVRWAEVATSVRLPYVSVGPRSATPVILLHAWAESRRSFDRLMPMLANTVHAVAPDQRGHGDADRPTNGYSLASLAQDILALLDALGISSAVLLGSSSGGYLAQQVCGH